MSTIFEVAESDDYYFSVERVSKDKLLFEMRSWDASCINVMTLRRDEIIKLRDFLDEFLGKKKQLSMKDIADLVTTSGREGYWL